MSIIEELENVISALECENVKKSLIMEYKNAVAILKDEKMITSCTLSHVIDDIRASIEFDAGKADEYYEAISKLQNASI